MRTFISIVFLLAFSNIYAANISAKLDVNPVLVNETFHLIYTASGSVDDEPDFSLIKNDFELLGTQQSSNMSMINGNITRSKTWTLTLLSKASGTFTIPAISFGADHAPEVKIIVKDVPVFQGATPTQNFILELEASDKSGFIQQQFIISVRLLIAQNINNYQFSDLTTNAKDTIILDLGKDQQYKTYRGNKQYIIIEKKFALFPQKSGSLTINPFIAAVAIPGNSSNSRFYDPFNSSSTTKRIQSEAIKLEIKDIPTTFKSPHWLPGTAVKLLEDWPSTTPFIAGEPITRTITLMAEGLSSAQLPELIQQPVNDLKQYPDKAVLEQEKLTTGISSVRKQKSAFIPTRAGSYTLPAMTVPWWNTKTNKIVNAQIAARTFNVLPAAKNSLNPGVIYTQPELVLNHDKTQSLPIVVNEQVTKETRILRWSNLVLFVLWLVTLVLWLRAKAKIPGTTLKSSNFDVSVAASLQQLKSACTANDAQATKTALLKWGKLYFTNSAPNNLADIAKLVDESLKQEVLTLNTYLYSNTASSWTCNNIYTLCKAYNKMSSAKKTNNNSAQLEPFNR